MMHPNPEQRRHAAMVRLLDIIGHYPTVTIENLATSLQDRLERRTGKPTDWHTRQPLRLADYREHERGSA